MKLATLRNGSPDGELLVMSADLCRCVRASGIATSLLTALESWDRIEARLRALSDALNRGAVEGAFSVPMADLAPPLPRTWQWLDGSAFPSHGELMARAFKLDSVEASPTRPLMYQGGSDDFLGPCHEMLLPSE